MSFSNSRIAAWKVRSVPNLGLVLGVAAVAGCTAPVFTSDMNCPGGPQNCAVATGGGNGTTGSLAGNMAGTTVSGSSGSGGTTTGVTVTGVNAGATSGPAGGNGPVVTGGGNGQVTPNGGGGPIATGGTGSVVGDGGSGSVSTGGSDPGGGGTGVVVPGGVLGTIVVSADALDRDHTIVTFPPPAAAAGKSVVLKDSAGTAIPLQISPADGNATFILGSLAAGQTATYTIEELAAPAAEGITAVEEVVQEKNQLFVKNGESTVFRWVLTDDNFRNSTANNVRAGYIFPLYTPSGLNVADDYQVDHPHMHGLWSAWTKTTFRGHNVDFWNGYANSGRVDLVSMADQWSGAVHAGLKADLVHSDITSMPSVPVLNETWVVTVFKTHEGTAPYYIFDIESVQQTVGQNVGDELVLEEFTYGGFGFRGSELWQTPSEVSYLTSEGHTRLDGDGQNARWCAQYGNLNGQVGGYAALDHPTNFRHPQGLRIHPTNPYWAFVPITLLKGGRATIDVGVPYHSHYRVVSFDGAVDSALIQRQWDDFATPPTVTVQ